jgi:hypothetical protein
MRIPPAEGWTRRCFLSGLTTAGTVGLLGLRTRSVAAEPPPETSTLRTNLLRNFINFCHQCLPRSGMGFSS